MFCCLSSPSTADKVHTRSVEKSTIFVAFFYLSDCFVSPVIHVLMIHMKSESCVLQAK